LLQNLFSVLSACQRTQIQLYSCQLYSLIYTQSYSPRIALYADDIAMSSSPFHIKKKKTGAACIYARAAQKSVCGVGNMATVMSE
jgi:hypothetical protein